MDLRQSKLPALLIIDMQNDFVLPGSQSSVYGALATIPKICEVLNYARNKEYPIFHLTRAYRADGSNVEGTRLNDFLNKEKTVVPGTYGYEIIKELTPLPNEYRIIKPRFSGFMQTELDFMLRRLRVTNLLVTGTQYPNCVRATAYDAICLDYETTVITDATSAASEEVASANIFDMKNIGIACMTFDDYKKTCVL